MAFLAIAPIMKGEKAMSFRKPSALISNCSQLASHPLERISTFAPAWSSRTSIDAMIRPGIGVSMPAWNPSLHFRDVRPSLGM